MDFLKFCALLIFCASASSGQNIEDNSCGQCSSPSSIQLATWAANRTGINPPRATNLQGIPVPSLTASQSVYPSGIMLFQDFRLYDKLSSFNMERIPERVVHAKGVGAHGYFTVTRDISQYTKAKFLNGIGKKTQVVIRFSSTNMNIASPDTSIVSRGFAVKLFTEEGNHDFTMMTGGTFSVRDPMLFSDLNKARMRNPKTNLLDRNMWWDFMSQRPESTLNLLNLLSTPGMNGYRRMNFGAAHAFKLVNAKGEAIYAKFFLRTLNPANPLTIKQIEDIAKSDPDYFRRDLYDAISRKDYPQWNLTISLMTLDQAKNYTRNPFDITRNWIPASAWPEITIGVLTLDRNPEDYFTEVEQLGFAPRNMVPGIEPSPDKMLHARLLSYADAQRYRIGVNGQQLPFNRPKSPVNSYQRNGLGCYGDNGGGGPNYFPNSFRGPEPDLGVKELPFDVEGWVDRYPNANQDEFVEARAYLESLSDSAVDTLISTIAYWLKDAREEIRERVYKNNLYPVSKEFGERVKAATEMAAEESKNKY